MAFTQTQLDVLEEAIAQGALRVRYSDKEVQYRSLSEMIQLRDTMRQELGIKPVGSIRTTASYNKGL